MQPELALWAGPVKNALFGLMFVILRFVLLAVAPALSLVLLQAGWGRLGDGGRFPLSQQLPLPLNVLPLRVDSLLLPGTCKNELA